MNRRQMVILPGLALAASRGFSQTQEAASSHSSASAGLSHKAVARYSRPKFFSDVPKSPAKQARYIKFLTTLLSLSDAQKTQTAEIFAAAGTAKAEAKSNKKTSLRALGEHVRSNDTDGIAKASQTLGTLAGERHSIAANAQAAFFQILTAEQQVRLAQFIS
jgi:Spy/CpxP family protein refolding chaperone